MNPKAQKIAIAEYLGWKLIKIDKASNGDDVYESFWWPPNVGEPDSAEVINDYGCISPPKYLKDLNAIHEAEKTLTDAEWYGYRDELRKVVLGPVGMVSDWAKADLHATAAQKAEAFLKFKGLWKE